MKNIILLLVLTTAIAGIVGFSFDFAATSFLRILFLITADLLVILLLSRLFFQTQNGKIVRRRKVRA